MKTFLLNDVRNQSLKNWIKRKCTPISHKCISGALYAVHDAEAVIQRIHDNIEQHRHGNNAKLIPIWENYVKQIKEM
jgi:hypothetical protein